MSVFDELVDVARADGLTLGTAESLTGGLLAYSLATSPGAGDVFIGALVAYHRSVKYGLLSVPEGPVVTPEAAATMAATARDLLGCHLAMALTGVAGPDPQDGMPVGTVFVAVDMGDGGEARRFHFEGRPDQIRIAAAEAAASWALERLI